MWESLLVVAGAFGATLLAIYINNVVFKPVLLIDESSPERVYDHGMRSWFYKLVVRNGGLKATTNCTATMNIKDIRKQDVYKMTVEDGTKRVGPTLLSPDSFSDTERDLSEESVPWDLGLREAFEIEQPLRQTFSWTINKQAQAKLSLFSISNDVVSNEYPVLFIEPKQYGCDRIALVGHRNYEGEITLTAGNANPRTISFLIEQDKKNQVNLKILKVKPKTRGSVLRQILWGQ